MKDWTPGSKISRALVHCRSIVNGMVRRQWDERRTIYFFDGIPHVSHLGQKKGCEASANADGTYSVDYFVRSLPVNTL
jgi:hypothetical protein